MLLESGDFYDGSRLITIEVKFIGSNNGYLNLIPREIRISDTGIFTFYVADSLQFLRNLPYLITPPRECIVTNSISIHDALIQFRQIRLQNINKLLSILSCLINKKPNSSNNIVVQLVVLKKYSEVKGLIITRITPSPSFSLVRESS